MATKSIVATKVGMTQVWDEDGRVVPVTVLRVQPCRVVQIKTPERDGYSAVQVTFGHRDARKLTMPEAGHFDAAGVEAGVKLVELRVDDVGAYEVGQTIGADTFAAGELVDITGVSKGKGFAGTMKRHGFGGAPASHGAHRNHRKPGAIGACATPARVFKGKKMSGRMGGEKVTTLNLTVIEADPDREIVLVRGSVPGPKKSTVLIRNAAKVAVTGGAA
jgi:large subunit ribosomal protein L3